MQTETFIIMIVGLLAIGLIRLIIAMVGREYAADHPHKSRTAPASPQSTSGDTSSDDGSAAPVPSQRPVRGTGRKSHLLYFPEADRPEGAADAAPPADSEPVLPSAS